MAVMPNCALMNNIVRDSDFFMISKRKNKSERPITCNNERFIEQMKSNMYAKHKILKYGTQGNHLSETKKPTAGLANATSVNITKKIIIADTFRYFL